MLQKLDVYFNGWGAYWKMGTLAQSGSTVLFEYSDESVARGFPFSPLKVPTRTQAYQDFPTFQDRLPGFLADSLPDGWGRRVMDRTFSQSGRVLSTVSVLDRLAFIHDRAMGAFVFVPQDSLSAQPDYVDLLAMAEGAQVFMAGDDTPTLRQLALAGGSPQGARPKVLVNYDGDSQQVSSLPGAPGSPWLVKFQAQGEHAEVCALESLYAHMARCCGIDMPATRHFTLNEKLSAFGIERFDRAGSMRVPTLSLAGLLETNFREPTCDYSTFLRATRYLTRDEREVQKAFERCVFNVLFNNRDDHTKNFAYVMTAQGEWKLAPAFDLTFNTGTAYEHQMSVLGEGKQPGRAQLLQLAKESAIPFGFAWDVIDSFCDVSLDLEKEAQAYAIRQGTLKEVARAVEINRKALRG